MIHFAMFGTSSIKRDNGVKIGPRWAAILYVVPAVVLSCGAERIGRPNQSALGVNFFLSLFIAAFLIRRYAGAIGGINTVFPLTPSLLKMAVFSAIEMLSVFCILQGTGLAKMANGGEFSIELRPRLFNLASRTNLESSRLRAFFHCDIIATKGEFKQDEFGENPERTTPSQAAHVSRKAEGRGRCNDQTPSESGNGSTSLLPQQWVKTWPELHGNMQKLGIKSLSDNRLTTIESRSGTVADNVRKNNALLTRLKERGREKTFSGGSSILQELSFQANSTAMYYSGAEVLNISPADVISAAQYTIKQAAVAVTINGLEMLQNSGEEQIIDLFDARLDVAEASIENLITTGIYSDGTGTNGKQITGLQAQVVSSPSSGVVGGIDRSTWSFWQNQTFDFSTTLSASASASNIQTGFDTLYAKTSRGSDVVDLITLDNNFWGFYMASLQNLQRFPGSSKMAELGFVATKFMNADVVLDGGIGGNVPAGSGYFLNTKYIFFRPHKDRNFVPIGDERMSTNQDAIVKLIGWAGNLTASGLQFQGQIQE